MSFLALKLIFAAVALALLVVVLLIVRQLRAKRSAKAAHPGPRTTARPRAMRDAAPTADLPAADPPPARRRQLQSFVDSERIATAAEAETALPVAPVVELAQVAEPEWMPEPEPAPPTEDEPAEDELAEDDPAAERDYAEVVLERLENAFEALESGELTLAAYRERLLAEQAAVAHRIALLEAGGESDDLAAAWTAHDSVQWCLDWAAAQAGERE